MTAGQALRTKAKENCEPSSSVEEFVGGIMQRLLTDDLRNALEVPQNREMLEFELTKAAEKVVRSGFKR